MRVLLLLTMLAGAPDAPRVSLDTELAAVSAWLQTQLANGSITPADAVYHRYFTSYAVPETPITFAGTPLLGIPLPATLRQTVPHTLSFVLNSLAYHDADGKSVPPVAIGPTLYTIDIRNYGWSIEQFEQAVAPDPYAAAPLVDPFVFNGQHYPGGNYLVRADWFIVAATDSRKQLDRGLQADDVISDILLYGRGKQPKTLVEFRELWGADTAVAAKLKADFGAIIDKGKSGVSRGSRRLIGVRTVLGEYWETRDAVNEDYLEQSLSDNFEAGEAITNNPRGLQVYALFNGAQKLVPDGDIKLVVDGTDTHDPRVRTFSSCVMCHPLGINEPAANEIAVLFKGGVQIQSTDYKEVLQKLERYYLSNKFDFTAQQANARYAGAVGSCNGLTPTQNAFAFKSLFDWYAYTDLSVDQAAVEVGLTSEAYLQSITATASGRLAALFRLRKPIPRQYWEAAVVEDKLIGGAYAESVLHIKGKTATPVALLAVVPAQKQVVVTAVMAQLKIKQRTLGEFPRGTVFDYVEVLGDWIMVRNKDVAGYIHRSQCRVR